MNNSRNYFLAFLNQAILLIGVSLDGPIFLVLGVDFEVALLFAFAARFLAFSVVFLAADWVAALALAAVAFALAGACLATVLAFAGAALTAFFAAVAVFLVVCDAESSFFAAPAIFFATAACIPALTNLAAPAVATFDTVSNLAATNFFAVAAPTPGIAVNFDAFVCFLPEAMVSPRQAQEQ